MQHSLLNDILIENEKAILNEWIKNQLESFRSPHSRLDLVREAELREQCNSFFQLFTKAARDGSQRSVLGEEWSETRNFLETFSRERALQGYNPSDTANFIFSLKRPLFSTIGQTLSKNTDALYETLWNATELLDNLGLITMEVFQKGRESVIIRQQQEMLELSTPVVKLWDGVLALPMIGTLDSARSQTVMESLLQAIMNTGSKIAIIDITGVPTVETVGGQHLMKTVAAARLMGADCIISGIRPQIAQTIVHLAIDLGGISTKATLVDAFKLALQRLGMNVSQQMARA